jgi:REP element-mobilizing transposase RayT
VGFSPPLECGHLSASRAAAAEEGAMAGTYTNLLYHLVFSTKGRFPLVTRELQPELYAYVGGIVRGEGGVLVEIGGMPDHVHLLAKFKPTAAVAEMLRLVKGSSSKWVNEEKFKARKFGWQDGYAAFSVSESQVDAVREYIRTQEVHHRGLSYQDEFRALLDRHGIEYDERYLWD